MFIAAFRFQNQARCRMPCEFELTDANNLIVDERRHGIKRNRSRLGHGRRAFFFGVNPLGAQEDGVQSEGAFNAGTAWGGGNFQGGTLDRNPDYKWDSRGLIGDLQRSSDGFFVKLAYQFRR